MYYTTNAGAVFYTREQIYPFLEEIPNVPLLNPVNPCTDTSFEDRLILKRLSCMARNYEIVLVANMGDKQPCNVTVPPCPPNGWYQFNTDVVFERDGTLIAKYHKVHLYGFENVYYDPGSSSTSNCVSFKTSFGVTFGIFTCFDLLYKEPPHCLINKGIRNIIFPTAWGSVYPFYVAAANQQSWSWKYKANLLAANRHMPQTQFTLYSTGSGIYSSGIAKQYYVSGEMLQVAMGHLITFDLPNYPDMEHNYTQVGIRTDISSIQQLPTHLNCTPISTLEGTLEASYTSTELEMTVKCRLDYNMKSTYPKELYALGAFIRSPETNSNYSYAACSLFKCAGSSMDTCGEPVAGYKASTVFQNVKLSGDFPSGSEVQANALLSELELVDPMFMTGGDSNLFVTDVNKPLLAASLVATF